MENTDFLRLYVFAFIFGVVCNFLHDLLWVVRISFLGNKFIWLTDILATSSAGIFISVLQYNFSSGRFRVLPFVIFPLGVLFARLTFSRFIRFVTQKIVSIVSGFVFQNKLKAKARFCKYMLLKNASRGFGALK